MNSKKIVSKKTEDKLAKLYLGLPVELQENVVKYINSFCKKRFISQFKTPQLDQKLQFSPVRIDGKNYIIVYNIDGYICKLDKDGNLVGELWTGCSGTDLNFFYICGKILYFVDNWAKYYDGCEKIYVIDLEIMEYIIGEYEDGFQLKFDCSIKKLYANDYYLVVICSNKTFFIYDCQEYELNFTGSLFFEITSVLIKDNFFILGTNNGYMRIIDLIIGDPISRRVYFTDIDEFFYSVIDLIEYRNFIYVFLKGKKIGTNEKVVLIVTYNLETGEIVNKNKKMNNAIFLKGKKIGTNEKVVLIVTYNLETGEIVNKNKKMNNAIFLNAFIHQKILICEILNVETKMPNLYFFDPREELKQLKIIQQKEHQKLYQYDVEILYNDQKYVYKKYSLGNALFFESKCGIEIWGYFFDEKS